MSVQHFDDNYNYHDASGDGGLAVDFVFCGCGKQNEYATTFGIFEQNDIPAYSELAGSPN